MITLLFGAGASFGSGSCVPKNPPLGQDLFTELAGLGGAFSRLDDQQKKIFIEQGFEHGMATVPNNSRQINPLQKELACYLSNFSIQADNAYARLFNKIRYIFRKIAIATLNYDLLIEQSLAHHGITFNYNGEGESVSLMKLHGSSNFLPEFGENFIMSGIAIVNFHTFVDGLKTNASSRHEEIKTWCNDPKNSDISPVIAIYDKGKRVVINRRLIERIQQNYADLVRRSSHVIIVGAKYIEHDQHVWEPINESNAKLLIVDPYPEATFKWVREVKRQGVDVLPKSFDKSVWDIAKYIRQAASSN